MKPSPSTTLAMLIAAATVSFTGNALALDPLHAKSGCTGCHKEDKKLVGPSYIDVADKYRADYKKDAKATTAKMVKKVTEGGSGVWGPVPMSPNSHLAAADIEKMVKEILETTKK